MPAFFLFVFIFSVQRSCQKLVKSEFYDNQDFVWYPIYSTLVKIKIGKWFTFCSKITLLKLQWWIINCYYCSSWHAHKILRSTYCFFLICLFILFTVFYIKEPVLVLQLSVNLRSLISEVVLVICIGIVLPKHSNSPSLIKSEA